MRQIGKKFPWINPWDDHEKEGKSTSPKLNRVTNSDALNLSPHRPRKMNKEVSSPRTSIEPLSTSPRNSLQAEIVQQENQKRDQLVQLKEGFNDIHTYKSKYSTFNPNFLQMLNSF